MVDPDQLSSKSKTRRRERILDNARRLARKDGWTDVYIAPDKTRKQREESKREEERPGGGKTRRTEEATKEGKKGKFVVVGSGGKKEEDNVVGGPGYGVTVIFANVQSIVKKVDEVRAFVSMEAGHSGIYRNMG